MTAKEFDRLLSTFEAAMRAKNLPYTQRSDWRIATCIQGKEALLGLENLARSFHAASDDDRRSVVERYVDMIANTPDPTRILSRIGNLDPNFRITG